MTRRKNNKKKAITPCGMMAFGLLWLLSFDYIIRAPAPCDTMVAVVVMGVMVAGRMMDARRMSKVEPQ